MLPILKMQIRYFLQVFQTNLYMHYVKKVMEQLPPSSVLSRRSY